MTGRISNFRRIAKYKAYPDIRGLACVKHITEVADLPAKLLPYLAALALTQAACSTLPPISEAVGPAATILKIQDDRLKEISGMGVSLRQPGVLWVHNDSGDEPRLFAVGPDGRILGILNVTNAGARDWEEMVVFEMDGKKFILIADVGDNGSIRQDTIIYIIEEPDPADFAANFTQQIEACAVIRFRYEDGPRDCEGVAVDIPNREILLISKRTEPPVLYRLPLTPTRDDDDPALIAKRSVPLSGIVPPTAVERAIPGRLGQYRSQVTAFDISPDNKTAAVLTYGNIYLYTRSENSSWSDTLAGEPTRIPVQGLPQAESICFDEGGATLLLTTEDKQPPLQRYRLR